jgi:hypothetical protein
MFSSNSSKMSVEVEYLIQFLTDELRDHSDIRILPVLPSGTRRSVDLVQDYDPESSDVHARHGVRVRAASREYFFPVSWVSEGRSNLVHEQAREIREFLEWKDTKTRY